MSGIPDTLERTICVSGGLDGRERALFPSGACPARKIGYPGAAEVVNMRPPEQVAALAPDDIETKLELGAALVASDRSAEAIATYSDIIKIDAKSVQAHKFIGDLYRKEGQRARAIRSYGLAIKANAKDPRAYFLLASMYVEDGNDTAARLQ